MFGAVSSWGGGLQQGVAQVTQVVDHMVNASSRGENIAEDVVTMKVAQVNVDASVKMLEVENDLKKRLLDILV